MGWGMMSTRRRLSSSLSTVALCSALACSAPVAAWAQADSAQQLPAGTIARVEVVGAQRIDPETIRSYLTLGPGDPFDGRKIDASLKQLFQTGLFSDVNLKRDGDTLVVTVSENPVINRIAFEGNERIKDDALQNEIELRPRVVFTRTKAQTDVERIEELYRRQGRYAAKVVPKIIQQEQNRVDLVFEIDEGPLSKIRRIQFVGNHRFNDDQLKEVIQSKETRWYRFLSSTDVYDPDRLTFDRELLRRYYLKNGYADFRVSSAIAELTPNREDFFITFTVEEGERYQLGDVTVTSEVPGLSTEALQSAVGIKSGDWYNADAVDSTIQAIQQRAGDLQFAFIDVTPRVRRNREKHTLDITLVVQEGRRAYVGKINITGNVRTLDEVIRREMELVEEDPFNVAALRRSEKRIKDLGFFSKVDVFTQPGDAQDKVDVEVNVTEQSTGELSFGAGFSTSDGLLGQDLKLSTTLSFKSSLFDISFTEPYFLDRKLAAGFDLYHTTRDNQSESSYDLSRTGLGLRLGYDLTEDLKQELGYTIAQTKVDNVDSDASLLIKEQEGSRIKSAVTQKLTYDQRDSKLFPTSGYVLTLSNELAGLGGDQRSIQTVGQGTYYIPISEGWTLSVGGEGGSIFGLGQDVPIYERFFLGGSSFRGFETGGLGPRDRSTGDSLGGEGYFKQTNELSFPLGLPDELGVSGRVFTDVGSIAGVSDTSGADVIDDFAIRASTGFGVSWRSPLGVIAIDYGIPVLKESYDKTESIRISFGTSF